MWLTKHEKEVLKLLLEDGKLSDTSMAEKLNISTQAIGRIRKRLEEDVIKKYSVELDSKMLGVNVISISKVNFNNSTPKDIELLEKTMIKEPRNINVLKIMSGEGDYIIVSGFKDIEELNNTIENYKKHITQHYNITETLVLPLSHVLKSSDKDLNNRLIDSCGVKHAEMGGGGILMMRGLILEVNEERFATLIEILDL